MKYERWIVTPDLQIPREDMRSLAAVEAYMRDVQVSDRPFTGWLNLGDFLDLPQLSTHVLGREASELGRESVWQAFEDGKTILRRHRAIMASAGVPFEMVLLEGNHDYRGKAYADRYPQLKELLDVKLQLQLDEMGIRFVEADGRGEVFVKGDAGFVHGNYVSQNHAKRMADVYCRNGLSIYYGHVHDVMEFPLVTRGKTLVAKSLGCLCDYDQPYLRGRPTNWQQAFSEFCFFEDGTHQEVTVKIRESGFLGLNGKFYERSLAY